MSMIRLATLSVLAVLAAGPAPAADENCADAATQGAADACAARGLAAVDARLNAAYNQVMGRLKAEPAPHAALLEAQRAWIRFRDAECAFATVNGGGSTLPFPDARCQARLTEERLRQLRDYRACGEGGLDCLVLAGG
jgi:uncharacterized protein YecT (DUF1311 family)